MRLLPVLANKTADRDGLAILEHDCRVDRGLGDHGSHNSGSCVSACLTDFLSNVQRKRTAVVDLRLDAQDDACGTERDGLSEKIRSPRRHGSYRGTGRHRNLGADLKIGNHIILHKDGRRRKRSNP